MPDIGYTVAGGTQRALNGAVRGMKITMPEDGSAGVTITVRIEDAAVGDSFRALIVSDTDNETVLASSDIRTDISTAGWYTFSGGSLASFDPSNGQVFTIAITSNSAAGANIYHDGSGASSFEGWVGSITSIDPVTLNGPLSADATRDFSIYMTYTAAGGGGETGSVGSKGMKTVSSPSHQIQRHYKE